MKRILILIVEDENFLVQALKDNFEAVGYAVDVALDGEDAIKKVQTNHPDLVLLDLLLPKKDGFFVLETLKKNPDLKSIPVVVLSNFGADDSIKKAIAAGADDYLVKSQHSIDEVIGCAKKHLSGEEKQSMQ